MAATEPQPQDQPAPMPVFRQLSQIINDLAPLMPRQEPQEDGSLKLVRPLTDLLRAAPKRFMPRMARMFESDILPALHDMAMAVGMQNAELEARLEALETHPILQLADVEDLDDPVNLDAFMADVSEMAREALALLDPTDARAERAERCMKLAERIRIGISIELEDEEDEDAEDEEDEDEEEETDAAGRSADSDDGGGETETQEAAPAEAVDQEPATVDSDASATVAADPAASDATPDTGA
jgi:hypothetical protein